jgi:hypothetical protein
MSQRARSAEFPGRKSLQGAGGKERFRASCMYAWNSIAKCMIDDCHPWTGDRGGVLNHSKKERRTVTVGAKVQRAASTNAMMTTNRPTR